MRSDVSVLKSNWDRYTYKEWHSTYTILFEIDEFGSIARSFTRENFFLMFGKVHRYVQYLRYSWIILLATHVIQIIRILDIRIWFYSSVWKKFRNIIHELSNYLWREKSSEQENADSILKSYELFQRLDFYGLFELFDDSFFYDFAKH